MTDVPSYPGAPRWMKVFVAVSVAAIAMFIGLHAVELAAHRWH